MKHTVQKPGELLAILRVVVVAPDGDALHPVAIACARLQLGQPTCVPNVEAARGLLQPGRYAIVFIDDALAYEQLGGLLDATHVHGVLGVIVMGGATSGERAFDYLRRGVDALLDKPLVPERVIATMDEVLHGPSLLERIAGSLVGRHGLKDVQDSIRRSMFASALQRVDCNRHAAARLLGINRRAVQLVAKELEDPAYYRATSTRLPGLSSVPCPLSSQSVPLAPDEVGRAVDYRVTRHDESVIIWRELALQSELTVERVFARVVELSGDGAPFKLLIDLSEASYPSAAVRTRLRGEFGRVKNVTHVAVVTGRNEALGLAARFVLGPEITCPVSVHYDTTSALEALRNGDAHATLARQPMPY